MALNSFIDESIIERRLSDLESEEQGQQWMEDFLQKEPVLAGFLFSEDLKILEEDEKSLFSYLIVALWSSASGDHYQSANVSPTLVEEIEEQNWERYMGQKGNFRAKLDVFYKSFTQEDLLALLEDLLESEPEESSLTNEGKDLIFIKTKTMLDVLMLPADS